ncbi:MAG: hypothetical protein IPF99_32245 [Deltaproteobacteria bacterium]|nr:hypothetical protein [Deltaproteobacteria bacterium]
MQGSTAGLSDRAHASCARQALSGERVYALHLDQPSRVSLRVAADYDVAVYVRRDCGDEVSELACNDDLEDARHAGVDVDLGVGTWFVFVDGYDSDSSGNFTLSVSARPTGPGCRVPPGRRGRGRSPTAADVAVVEAAAATATSCGCGRAPRRGYPRPAGAPGRW